MATIDNRNAVLTRIQIESNDVVSFLNGTDYIRAMSQIMPQGPAYISYAFDTITISQVAGDAFTFSVYTITDVGGISFTPLTFQDIPKDIQDRTIEIYRLLVTSIFKGCCECGNTEPECSIQYKYDEDPTLLGTFAYDGTTISFNYTTGNNQDFTGFFPIVQDGSWAFLFSKTDPTIYAVIQLSNFVDQTTHAQFDVVELNAQGTPFVVQTEFCIDFTSVGGSLVQGWQDTLDINSTLNRDNSIDGGAFNFEWTNVTKYDISSYSTQNYESTDGSNSGTVKIDPGAVTITGSSYIDIITPGYPSASTGWVLALNASGHVEYVEAGTGTISSIELIMPPAFTVSDPNPLTTNGTFTVTVDGTEDQYINGLGELATFPVYTVENGLHAFGGVPGEAPADPYLFHLGGELVENTTITVTNGANQYALGVSGLANQDTQQPFGVSNLGNGGVATFQDYASGSRTNSSVEIIGDNDTWRPLLDLGLEGPLPNPGNPAIWENHNSFLRLKHTGDTGVGARIAIDYTFKNTSVSPSPDINLWPAVKLIAEATSVTEDDETSNFSIRMYQGGSQQDKLLLEGKGQLTLNEYGTGTFTDGTTNINNSLTYLLGTDNTGRVWKKLAGGGGTVTSVSATGLLTTSPNPITVSGTVTSQMASGFLVGRYSADTGVFEQITVGAGLDLSAAGVLTADGSVPVYTVNNGLEPQTDPTSDPFNFQLGGPLVRDTTITGDANSYVLNINDLSAFNSTAKAGYNFVSSSGVNTGTLQLFPNEFYVEVSDDITSTYIDQYADSLTLNSGGNINIESASQTSIKSFNGYSNYVPQTGSAATINSTHDMFAGYSYIRTRDTSGSGDTFNEIYMKSANGGSRHMAMNSFTDGRAVGIFLGISSNFSSSIPNMKVTTPNVDNGSATVGQVLTLKSMSGNDIGRVEFEDAGGGGTYDSDQGIYKDTSLANDTFMLGAPYGLASAIKFLEERQVDTDVYTLYIEGVISGGFVSVIQNNSDGNGLFVSAPQAYGLDALTDSGRAVNATANDAGSYAVFASNKIGTGTYTYSRDTYALNAVSQDGVPGKFEIGKNSLTASIFDVIQLRATNIDVTGGISIASQLNTIPVSNLITKWTTYNDVSQFEIQTKPSGGAISTNLVVKGTGQLQLNNYTTATSFDPESGPSIGVLNVDNAGNVFVGDGGGGGGVPFAIASGTDTYTATVSGVTAYTDGDAYLIRFTNGNTDSATLNINSLGARPLHQTNQIPLIGGDIWDGGEMLCIYNATDNSFECVGTAPNSLFAYVTNAEGSTISKGQAVYAFSGTGNRMTVKLARANQDSTSAQTIGFVFSSSIGINQKGIIIIQGYFTGLNLFPPASGWLDGDPVYLSPTTAGAVTRTKPYAPNHLVYLGVVATANPGSSGRMYVRVQNGYELDELHNVQAQSPNLNDTIRYDTADSQWKTASVPSLSGTFSIGVTVDGSGGTITAGVKGYVRVPYACTINTWSILTGNSGVGATITFDIWRANNAIPTAGSPPLIGAGGTKPFLTSNTSQITSAAPSGWASVTLAANDILAFNVETGAAVFSWANLQLLVTKS